MPSERARDDQYPHSIFEPGIIHHPSDVAFDRLAKLAARLLDVPIALVTLVAGDQLYLPGIYGLGEPWLSQRAVPLEQALCRHVVTACEPVAFENLVMAPLDEHALLSMIGAHAYIGVPLRRSNGKGLGTICVFDQRTRRWNTDDISALIDLAAITETEIAMRHAMVNQTRLSQYQIAQRSAFEQIAVGKPLSESLSTLALGIEGQIASVTCAIMLLDEAQSYLHTVAAPSLHPTYSRTIDGIRIGPQAGPCGLAAFSGKPVITTAIANDPIWQSWHDLALSYNLHTCWAIPVRASNGQTLGVFAIYDQAVHHPSEAEFDLVLGTANVVAVAIERWRMIDALRSSEARLRRSEADLAAVFEHTNDAIWSVDADLRVVTINGRAVSKLRVMTGAIVRQGTIFDQGMPNTQRVFWRGLYHRALGGERFSVEQPYTDGGVQRWCEISLNPIHMDGGISGISIFSRDLTERKRAEAERLAMERS
ncbi:MAG: GAF domain-containing protein, partial [Oscillochloris sp.]|nr:GAF domain-containing protein [Oscillochloris sp.]